MSKENDNGEAKGWLVNAFKENWWRVLLFILLTANLWLNNNYVTRQEYKSDKDAERTDKVNLANSVDRMNVLISGLEKQLAVMQAGSVDKTQTEMLADHEARIRALERKQ